MPSRDALGLPESPGPSHPVQREFIAEGTFCPGFQFRDRLFDEPVLRLFERARGIQIPHKVFRAEMISLVPHRSMGTLDNMPLQHNARTGFAGQYRADREAPLTGYRHCPAIFGANPPEP